MQLQKEHGPLSEAEFLRLIQDRSDSFYRVAYGYVRNCEDAKDIVQEAVCKAYVGKAHLKNPDRFYPWFYRILTNTAVSFLRKHAHTTLMGVAPPEEQAVNAEEQWGDAIWIRDALGRIDPQSRTVVILKIYESMTFCEIAQVLKKTENTVKSIYYRALKSLKERMQVNGC